MECGRPRGSHQQGYGLSESLPIKAEMETWVQVIWGESTRENEWRSRERGREARESSAVSPAELTPQTSSFQSPERRHALKAGLTLERGSNICPRDFSVHFLELPQGCQLHHLSLLLGPAFACRPAQSPSSEKVPGQYCPAHGAPFKSGSLDGEAFEGA